MVTFGIVMVFFGIITCLQAIVLVMMRRNAREIRGYLRTTDDRVSGLGTLTHGMSASLDALRRDLSEIEALRKEDAAAWMAEDARTVDALQGVFSRLEALPKLEADVAALLERDAASEIVKRLEAQLREAPEFLSADDESRRSRTMEEGISSILAYTAGKVPGVELRL